MTQRSWLQRETWRRGWPGGRPQPTSCARWARRAGGVRAGCSARVRRVRSLGLLLGKVEAGVFAEGNECCRVVSACCFFGSRVVAERLDLSLDRDAGSPALSVGVPIHALEAREAVPPSGSVRLVLRRWRRSEVHSPVVETVAVDVIDESPASDEAVHGARRPPTIGEPEVTDGE